MKILTDKATRASYATDASIYREYPYGVAFPKNEEDIILLLNYAKEHQLTLIPRAGGTSLAGQVVGNGIVADISHHFKKIIEINEEEQYAIIQPGVVRDDLNLLLKEKNLFFAPETATSNRCCIGGMFGNNSCGTNSLLYGSTRQHIKAVKAILSDGSKVEFKELSPNEFEDKCKLSSLEGTIYRNIKQLLSPEHIRTQIEEGFPHPSIHRRSMGYAIDELLLMQPFTPDGHPFNLCTLLTGSEGTLAFITELTIHLSPLPPKHKALLCVQTNSIQEALEGNLLALNFSPSAVELIDHTILELSSLNISQSKNRFFLQGTPEALLVIEFTENTPEKLHQKIDDLKHQLQSHQIGYHYPVVNGKEIAQVWALRKAGLGILSNMKGDAKPMTVVEDIAILPEDYPNFYKEFKALLNQYNLQCVFYAHIATGELHNKPIFNLKNKNEVLRFREFAFETAKLVKKYRGALSGEHGDGRLRGEFLSYMLGEENYELLKKVKHLFDPNLLFNKGKIMDSPPMNSHLRHASLPSAQVETEIKTMFDFSDTEGLLRSIEKCSGSADCRKSHLQGGTMCPSYMGTLDEQNSTRSRANILREFINSNNKKNPFDHHEILMALDNCLACKACKSECPSNVDMTKLRAEFLYHYYQQHHQPFRNILIAYYPILNQMAMPFHKIYNYFISNKISSVVFKKIIGFSTFRSIPTLYTYTLRHWYQKQLYKIEKPIKSVYLFVDEFTNTQDVQVGISSIKLLQSLHYEVRIIKHPSSGRTFLSKGFLKQARRKAEENISIFSSIIKENTPLIGIEPSAILSFRDEYPELVRSSYKKEAIKLAQNTYLIDEFIANEFSKGHISSEKFTDEPKTILFHSHCYQKVLSDVSKSICMMEIPQNYHVKVIESGCCGMAGAFGYEKEHYDLSMKIGALNLFPAIQNKEKGEIVTATGTSCRHQIKDGTGEIAFHPIEILYQALQTDSLS